MITEPLWMQRQEHYRMKRGNTELTKHTNRTHTQNMRGTDLLDKHH